MISSVYSIADGILTRQLTCIIRSSTHLLCEHSVETVYNKSFDSISTLYMSYMHILVKLLLLLYPVD